MVRYKQLRITHTHTGAKMLLEKVAVDVKNRMPEIEGFTLEDLKSQLLKFEQPEPIYTKEKNEKSYWLAGQISQVRGRAFEYALAERIERETGWKAEVTHCGDRFDVMLTNPKGRRRIRLEMKSSLLGRKKQASGIDSYSYKFQEMKPELTDFFILIRVDPYHGPIIDVITTVQARKATEKQNSEAKTLHCSMVGRYCRGELKAMTLTEFVLGLVG